MNCSTGTLLHLHTKQSPLPPFSHQVSLVTWPCPDRSSAPLITEEEGCPFILLDYLLLASENSYFLLSPLEPTISTLSSLLLISVYIDSSVSQPICMYTPLTPQPLPANYQPSLLPLTTKFLPELSQTNIFTSDLLLSPLLSFKLKILLKK